MKNAAVTLMLIVVAVAPASATNQGFYLSAGLLQRTFYGSAPTKYNLSEPATSPKFGSMWSKSF